MIKPLSFSNAGITWDRAKILLKQYDQLMQSGRFIPCEKLLPGDRALILAGWKEKLLLERLQNKAWLIDRSLQKNRYHWEEEFLAFLARNFGYPVNKTCFGSGGKHTCQVAVEIQKATGCDRSAITRSGRATGKNLRRRVSEPVTKEYRFCRKNTDFHPYTGRFNFFACGRPISQRSGWRNWPRWSISSHLFSVIRIRKRWGCPNCSVSAHAY